MAGGSTKKCGQRIDTLSAELRLLPNAATRLERRVRSVRRIATPRKLHPGPEIEGQPWVAQHLLVVLAQQVVENGIAGDVPVDPKMGRQS